LCCSLVFINVYMYYYISPHAPSHIYPHSLHDALPIFPRGDPGGRGAERGDAAHAAPPGRSAGPAHAVGVRDGQLGVGRTVAGDRSEEHTSELQSRRDLVCRLLFEKKKSRIVAITGRRTFWKLLLLGVK